MAKAKAKTKTKAKAAPRGGQESLLVGAKVRQLIRDADCNCAADALVGANQWVSWLVAQATARAKANGRKTVRAHDFMVP